MGCIALMVSLLSVVCRLMRRECCDPVPVTVVSGKHCAFLPFLPWGMPQACQHSGEDGEGPAAPTWGVVCVGQWGWGPEFFPGTAAWRAEAWERMEHVGLKGMGCIQAGSK